MDRRLHSAIQPPSEADERFAYIDWLKAIGIFLVVYGHSQGLPKSLYSYIYSFHMPLFFFIAGLTMKESKLKKPFLVYTRQVSKSIIPPYLFFCLIGFTFWLIIGRRHDPVAAGEPFWRPLLAILYGSGTGTNQLFPVILWFFPCLFCTLLLYRILAAFSPLITFASVFASVAAGMLLSTTALPWEFETALLAVPFVWMGSRYRTFPNMADWLKAAAPWILPTLLFVAVVTSALNTSVDMRKSSVGNIGIFLLSATASIAALLTLSLRLPVLTFVRHISSGTIAIFPLHPYVFWAAAFAYTTAWGNADIKSNYLVALAVSCTAVAMLTLVAPVITKVLSLSVAGTNRSRP